MKKKPRNLKKLNLKKKNLNEQHVLHTICAESINQYIKIDYDEWIKVILN